MKNILYIYSVNKWIELHKGDVSLKN